MSTTLQDQVSSDPGEMCEGEVLGRFGGGSEGSNWGKFLPYTYQGEVLSQGGLEPWGVLSSLCINLKPRVE